MEFGAQGGAPRCVGVDLGAMKVVVGQRGVNRCQPWLGIVRDDFTYGLGQPLMEDRDLVNGDPVADDARLAATDTGCSLDTADRIQL